MMRATLIAVDGDNVRCDGQLMRLQGMIGATRTDRPALSLTAGAPYDPLPEIQQDITLTVDASLCRLHVIELALLVDKASIIVCPTPV